MTDSVQMQDPTLMLALEEGAKNKNGMRALFSEFFTSGWFKSAQGIMAKLRVFLFARPLTIIFLAGAVFWVACFVGMAIGVFNSGSDTHAIVTTYFVFSCIFGVGVVGYLGMSSFLFARKYRYNQAYYKQVMDNRSTVSGGRMAPNVVGGNKQFDGINIETSNVSN